MEDRTWEAFLLSKMSGCDRARLALVGDAKDWICRRVGRLFGSSEGGIVEAPTGMLVVGDVFRLLGAEESMKFSGYFYILFIP